MPSISIYFYVPLTRATFDRNQLDYSSDALFVLKSCDSDVSLQTPYLSVIRGLRDREVLIPVVDYLSESIPRFEYVIKTALQSHKTVNFEDRWPLEICTG